MVLLDPQMDSDHGGLCSRSLGLAVEAASTMPQLWNRCGVGSGTGHLHLRLEHLSLSKELEE